MSRKSILFGLVAGAVSAGITGLVFAVIAAKTQNWQDGLLVALGIWGWFSVQQLWTRHELYARILAEHGLTPKE